MAFIWLLLSIILRQIRPSIYVERIKHVYMILYLCIVIMSKRKLEKKQHYRQWVTNKK